MTATGSVPRIAGQVGAARKAGYVAAIAINVVMLYVANHLLEWDLLPFLTEEFDLVLWPINVSIGATVLANASYLAYDRAWFKSLGQIALNAVSMVVGIRMFQVFPFDFSAYEFDWATVARVLIVLTMVALVIGTVAELVKLAGRGLRAGR